MNVKKIKALFKREDQREAAQHKALAANKSLEKENARLCKELGELRAAPLDPRIFDEWKCKVRRLELENERLDSLAFQERKDASFLRQELAQANAQLDEYRRAVTLSTYDEGTARACLCQLRVMQMNVRGRTGYGVTAFITQEVLERLRTDSQERRLQFRDAVFTSLLERALAGMWHINSRGNISAVLFAPLGSAKEGICGAVFDVDTNPHVELARSRANDGVVRRIEQAIIDAQKENCPQRDNLESGPAQLPREAKSEL